MNRAALCRKRRMPSMRNSALVRASSPADLLRSPALRTCPPLDTFLLDTFSLDISIDGWRMATQSSQPRIDWRPSSASTSALGVHAGCLGHYPVRCHPPHFCGVLGVHDQPGPACLPFGWRRLCRAFTYDLADRHAMDTLHRRCRVGVHIPKFAVIRRQISPDGGRGASRIAWACRAQLGARQQPPPGRCPYRTLIAVAQESAHSSWKPRHSEPAGVGLSVLMDAHTNFDLENIHSCMFIKWLKIAKLSDLASAQVSTKVSSSRASAPLTSIRVPVSVLSDPGETPLVIADRHLGAQRGGHNVRKERKVLRGLAG